MRRLNPLHDEGTKDIDISPLIDVVFILLIFFMVSTTFVKDAALDIERPGAQSASPAPAQTLRVSLLISKVRCTWIMHLYARG